MCKRGYSEEIISKNPELVFSSDGGQHEVVLTDAYAQAHIPTEGKTILIELSFSWNMCLSIGVCENNLMLSSILPFIALFDRSEERDKW